MCPDHYRKHPARSASSASCHSTAVSVQGRLVGRVLMFPYAQGGKPRIQKNKRPAGRLFAECLAETEGFEPSMQV
jgi:hypothetical protein